jgi:hypothetical protein
MNGTKIPRMFKVLLNFSILSNLAQFYNRKCALSFGKGPNCITTPLKKTGYLSQSLEEVVRVANLLSLKR